VALPPRDGRIIRVALPLTDVRDRVRSVRVILGTGFGAAALVGLLTLAVVGRGSLRPLRRITDAVESVAEGDPGTEVPEEGTEELVLLASTVNRMRAEIEARIRSVEEERATRDAILSGLEEGVVLFDPGGGVLYRNGQVERLLGYVPASSARLAPNALARLVRSVLQRTHDPATADGLTGTVAFDVRTDGRTRNMIAGAVTVPSGRGVLLVLRDVTESRSLEAIRRDFVANASHELKTPTASIRALAETIATSAADDPEALHRFAAQLESEAVRLSRIIGDLLDLSRLEGGMEAGGALRLDQVVNEEARRSRARAEAADLSLEVHAGEALTVRGSAQDMALLVRNLVENAVQYTKPGGRVDVSLSTEDEDAVLTVRDTGVGIPSRDRRRVFERFYRVDRARSRETGGTGLGLSIVKHVAENHGGSVEVQGELGQGSTFIVRIPLAR
jgi:signal transduction histidine kinase